MKMPDGGSLKERDSLMTYYFENVTKKNPKILSARTLTHYFTADSHDYLELTEFKNISDIEASFLINTDMEKKVWPDEKKRTEFMDKMNSYFSGHADAIYWNRSKLVK